MGRGSAHTSSDTRVTDDVIVAACLVSIAAVAVSVIQSSNRRDFAYLAFTIGMSYGVSEVEPNTTGTRRKALMHALLSYFFGTVLIAVAINLVTSLGGQG